MNMSDVTLRTEQFVSTYRQDLQRVDFEFAYLLALTACDLKPLSRIEWSAERIEQEVINRCGLAWSFVDRIVGANRPERHTVFSASAGMVGQYVSHFSGQPLILGPDNMRLEGRLFGYPECCIRAYIQRSSQPGSPALESSQLLFHWPCTDCKHTPALLAACRQVHARVTQMHGKLSSA